VSTLLYNTVATYTLDLEAVSCDELYADITSVLRQSGLTPAEFATHLKEVIFNKTQCNASVGMGPNMLMARLATKKAKPNGLFYINKKDMNEFMKNHKVEDLPGVGRSMAHRFHGIGVRTCIDMQQVCIFRAFRLFKIICLIVILKIRLAWESSNKNLAKSKVRHCITFAGEKTNVF
jgi:DNA repair protein REV1